MLDLHGVVTVLRPAPPDVEHEPLAWVRLLAPVLEPLEECILLVEPPAPPCYRNLAARRLLTASSGESDSLEQAIHRVACAAARAPDRAASGATELHTSSAHYRLRAHAIGAPAAGGAPGPSVLVVVAPIRLQLPRREALMRSFGLTAREADVGRLLAQGLRNTAIAMTLALSPNTVRHYTESVMAKLGVHTRAAVARALLGAPPLPHDG